MEYGCNVYLAEAIKKAIKKPVSCVGALNDPDKMEEILKSGKADLIAMGRALVADPELPNKIRHNQTDRLRYCLHCVSCHGLMLTTRNTRCTVNPVIGQELECKYQLPAKHKYAESIQLTPRTWGRIRRHRMK